MARKKSSVAAAPAVAVSRKFNSLHEFSSWLAETPVTPGFEPSSYGCSHSSANSKFYGTPDYDTAENMMLGGWDSGAADVKKIMLERCGGYEIAKRLALSVVGVIPCIPAYMANSPKNMISIKRRNIAKPVVTICYNCAVPSFVDAKDITTAAAKILNVVRGLEAGGVGVELWACSFSQDQNGKDTVSLAVKIKSSSEPFNVLNMAYPLIHPSFNRRHKFAFIERCGVCFDRWCNYGVAISNRSRMAELAESAGIEKPICFSYSGIFGKTESEIADMIK